MSEEFATDYKDEDIVWVKLGSSWWPAEVKDPEKLPPDILEFKKPPLVIVKFFDEDSYEYIRSWTNIFPYNCDKKNEFIKKGMVAFRAKTSHMEKFPKDVTNAEVKSGGNPNILSDPMFIPEKKRNYAAEVFGSPSPKAKSLKDKKRSRNKKDATHVTHRRFIGLDDYKAFICIQYPGKDRIPGDLEDDEVIRINKEPEQEYNCYSCGFTTKRLEVMILHTKSHIYGTYSPKTYKRPAASRPKKKERIRKPKKSIETTATDFSSSDSDGPKEKKRKTKPSSSKKAAEDKLEAEEPKRPADFRSDLLAEWEISEDELDDTMNESLQDQTTENESTRLEETTDIESSFLDRKTDAERKLDKPKASTEITALDKVDKPMDSIETIALDDSKSPVLETEEVIELIEDEDSLPATKAEARKSPKPKMDKETQEAIKSCFDFDEDEEDEHAIISTTTVVGRKIPRVIPPTERRKSDISDEVIIIQDKDREAKSGEKDEEEQLTNEEIDNAFRELMQSTEVPELPRVHNALKCEQNFHSVKTIKFPDKPTVDNKVDSSPAATETRRNDPEEAPSKSITIKEPSTKTEEKADQEVATKLTNPKKRFVKCFEDFELMQNEIRRKEEQQNEETRRGEVKKPHLEKTIEDRVEERVKAAETKTDQAVNKPVQNVEKELETIFGSLSKTPDYEEEDSLLYCSMKTKIMSSIMEEANINEESRNKIMSKMQKKHRSPRSKILETYLHDKSKHEESPTLKKSAQTKDEIEKRLMPEKSKEDSTSSAPPRKDKWTRRRSYTKKHRHLFESDDDASRNESCSSLASELSQRLSRDEETSQTAKGTSDTSKYANESRVSNESSQIEELLETLESSNENSLDNKMETVTIESSLSVDETLMKNIIADKPCKSPQHADTSNEEQNSEIAEICANIRKAQKDHTSEEESFPFNVLSSCEREEFSPIGNASRVLPDDAICLPQKKSKKRKKSRHKSSKSKRRRKHSRESETGVSTHELTAVAERPIDSLTAAKSSTDSTQKIDSSPVAENPIDISAVAESPIDTAAVADIPIDSTAVAESLVDSSPVAGITTDNSAVAEITVDSSPAAENPIVCSPVAESPADSSVVAAESFLDSSAVAESPVDSSAVAEILVDSSTAAESPVDTSTVAESPVDTSTVSESPFESPTVAENPTDSSVVADTIVDDSAVAETTVDHSNVAEAIVDDSAVAEEGLVDSSAMTTSFLNSSAIAESPIDNSAVAESPIDNSDVAESPIDNSAVAESTIDNSAVAESFIDNSAVTESSIDSSAVAESPIDNSGAVESPINNSAAVKSPIDNSAVAESPIDNSAVVDKSLESATVVLSSMKSSAFMYSPIDSPEMADSSFEDSDAVSAILKSSFGNSVANDEAREGSAVAETSNDRSAVALNSVDYPAVSDRSVDHPAEPSMVFSLSERFFSHSTADQSSFKCSIDLSVVADASIDYPALSERFLNNSAVVDSPVDKSAVDESTVNQTETFVDASAISERVQEGAADGSMDSSALDDRNETLEEATAEVPLVNEMITDEEVVISEALDCSQQKTGTEVSGDDQVQDQVHTVQHEEELIYLDDVEDHFGEHVSEKVVIGEDHVNEEVIVGEDFDQSVVTKESNSEHVTEKAILGEDHINEEVVVGEDLDQSRASRKSTPEDLHPFIEQISNEGMFDENNDKENLQREDSVPFQFFTSNNRFEEPVISNEVVLEKNLAKSGDDEFLTEDIVETVEANEIVEQQVSFTDETLVDVAQSTAAKGEELVQDHNEIVATETLAASHEEKPANDQSIEAHLETLEETIEDGVVIDFERQDLFEEKRDELVNIEERVLDIGEVDSDRVKESETVANEIGEGEVTKNFDESGLTKEKEESLQIDSNVEDVNTVPEKEVFERDNESFDVVQPKDSEIPSEIDIFQEAPVVVNLPIEEEVEIDSFEKANESFELIQNKSDNEVNLLEQEVVQEINIETEEIMLSNAHEMGNINNIRNETAFIEEFSEDTYTEQHPLIDSEIKKIDETVPGGENISEAIESEMKTTEAVPVEDNIDKADVDEANIDDANIDKSLQDIVFQQKLTSETHSEVDETSVEMPSHFEDLTLDKLTVESSIVEQDVDLGATKLPEVDGGGTKVELERADDNTESIVIDAATRDITKDIFSNKEESADQASLLIEQEKIVEEVVTEVIADNTLPEEALLESNKLEVKCVSDTEDEFKFSIQTNLSNLTSREEISAIALATLAEMKTDFENSDSNASEDILQKADQPVPEKLSEPELVAMEGNLTVVSEKDLADGQVEITSEKVISSKKPATLSSFSMDFSDSTNDSTSTSSDIIGKFPDFDSKGTEFSSRAITKELKPKGDIKKANTYERYELLDILEGNSELERRAEYHAPKLPFDADMCDFEEHIPSQIVCSSKFKQDMEDIKDEIKKKEKPHKSSIMSTTSKLLERLSESKSGDPTFKMEVKPMDSVVVATAKEVASNAGTSLIPKMFKPITLKTKPIIISEQIIKPATEVAKPVEKPKNMLNDIEDVEAFVIHKDIKKHVVEEEPQPDLSSLRPARASRRKAGKANILQQTIITPAGEIIQPALTATGKKRAPKQIAIKSLTLKTTMMNPPASKSVLVNPAVTVGISSMTPLLSKPPTSTVLVNPPAVKPVLSKPLAASPSTTAAHVAQDDNIFDINSMPIVLSDEILTPESIENMPIVIGSDALTSTSKPAAQEKATPVKRPAPLLSKVVTTPAQTLLTTKPSNVTPKISRPRILQTVSSKASKVSPLLPSTPKPGKYIILPQGALPQGTTAAKFVTKKAVMKRTPVTSAAVGLVSKPPNLAPEPSGNKIMIVTNQQGQQQRLLLTPAQQKMLGYQTQGTKLTKTVMKGSVMPKGLPVSKTLPVSKAATMMEAGTSKMPSLLGQKLIISTSSGHSLMATTSQVVAGATLPGKLKSTPKQPVVQKKVGSSGKTPKTILITSKQGHTVKKITTTEDDIEKQVAEQLEAIKARSGMKLGPLPKPVTEPVGLTACKPVHKTPSRRSYSKKVEQKGKAGPVFGAVQHTPKSETLSTPPPLVVTSTTSRRVPVSHPGESRKLLPEEPKPHPDRPLNQLVIQDAVGNQTTITEGQILALPSETVGGHPQSYMLVTLDESGNLTPLNNEALLSLDPNLGLGGDLSNMVLQIDQGALSSGPEQTMPLAQPAHVKLSNPGEALRAGTSKIDIPIDNAPVTIPVASTTLQETVIDPRLTRNVLSIPDAPIGMQQPMVPSSNGEPTGQQLIVTGDPIATQKFLESLTEGTTDLANIIASAEGKSILIQADGQQILINATSDNQMLLSMNNNMNQNESTEGGGNPIFSSQPNKNTDILAAALADTDVFSAQPKLPTQLSPGAALYPMNVGNVLETITLNSPIMTPLEVASTNVKKISDETDILSQVPKNVDLPITITDPTIVQTVANQQVATLMPTELQTNLELNLPMSESMVSTGLTSPGYVYSLPTLDESVDMSHKPFNSSMPLLNDDIEEQPQQPIQMTKKHSGEAKERDLDSRRAEDAINSGRAGSFLEEESRFTLGGEMCSSLSEPPPEMFDIPEVNSYVEKHANNIPLSLRGTPDLSDGLSKDGDTTDLSTQAESSNDGSCEIPLQPRIVARAGPDVDFDSIRRSDGKL